MFSFYFSYHIEEAYIKGYVITHDFSVAASIFHFLVPYNFHIQALYIFI